MSPGDGGIVNFSPQNLSPNSGGICLAWLTLQSQSPHVSRSGEAGVI